MRRRIQGVPSRQNQELLDANLTSVSRFLFARPDHLCGQTHTSNLLYIRTNFLLAQIFPQAATPCPQRRLQKESPLYPHSKVTIPPGLPLVPVSAGLSMCLSPKDAKTRRTLERLAGIPSNGLRSKSSRAQVLKRAIFPQVQNCAVHMHTWLGLSAGNEEALGRSNSLRFSWAQVISLEEIGPLCLKASGSWTNTKDRARMQEMMW